jgi:hypothetical protein
VPTIFAMGGGGFTMEPGNPALDDYVRAARAGARAAICPPHRGGDSEDQIRRFYAASATARAADARLALPARRAPVPLREHLLAQDVIYVGGGSMVNLLALWRAHGLDASCARLAGRDRPRRAERRLDVLVRVGRHQVDRRPRAGAGSASCRLDSVHLRRRAERRPFYLAPVRRRGDPAGLGLDDGAGSCSAARARRGRDLRARARAPTACTRPRAGPVEEASSRAARRAAHGDPRAPLAVTRCARCTARRGDGSSRRSLGRGSGQRHPPAGDRSRAVPAAARARLRRLRLDSATRGSCPSRTPGPRDLLGVPARAGTALLAALRAQVERAVGGLDHVEVVLDHHDRVARVHEPLQHLEQLLDVGEVQAGRRLVEDVERPPVATLHSSRRA